MPIIFLNTEAGRRLDVKIHEREQLILKLNLLEQEIDYLKELQFRQNKGKEAE